MNSEDQFAQQLAESRMLAVAEYMREFGRINPPPHVDSVSATFSLTFDDGTSVNVEAEMGRGSNPESLLKADEVKHPWWKWWKR